MDIVKNSLIAAIFLLVGTVANAAPTVYVVDMSRVVNESAVGIAAKAEFEADVKKNRASIEKQQLELKQQLEAMKRQSAVLSGSALEAKQEELRKKELAFRRAVMDGQQDLARKNNIFVEKISNEANKVMIQLAREKGYGFIIEKGKQFVVYADDSLDLTDQVIKLLNEKKLKF